MTQLTGAYAAPRTEAEARAGAIRDTLLAAYFRWREYADRVQAETGLRPPLLAAIGDGESWE